MTNEAIKIKVKELKERGITQSEYEAWQKVNYLLNDKQKLQWEVDKLKTKIKKLKKKLK